MDSVRAPARTFRDLSVWRKAHEFVLGVYQLIAERVREGQSGQRSLSF